MVSVTVTKNERGVKSLRLNIYEALMQKAYLFGALVLHSGEPIPREDVPLGWYCYDLRGTSRAPHSPYSMVDQADKFHTGSVLSLLPLKSERTQSRLVKDQFRLTQEFVSLNAFCAGENIPAPEIPFRHQMRLAITGPQSHCVGCPYPCHGFVCGNGETCLRTEVARIMERDKSVGCAQPGNSRHQIQEKGVMRP